MTGRELKERTPALLRRHSLALVSAGMGLLAFLLYARTLAPGLTWQNSASDGGDLLAAAFTWGIPHPTGYPTYLVGLRAFSSLVPFGSESLHGNLYSALAAAAAVGLLVLATVRVLRTLPVAQRVGEGYVLAAAALGGLAFAASRELWSQATVTEVYALNALFVSAVLLAALGLRERQRRGGAGLRYGAWVGLLSGVALGNHLTIGAFIVPLVAWALLARGPGGIRFRHAWPIMLGGAAGLGVYAYAPIASSQSPLLNWGHPDNAEGFWWMVSGTVYQGYAFGVTGGELVDRLVTSADLLLAQFAFIGLLLGLAGTSATWAGRRTFVLAQVVGTALLVGYAVTYQTVDSFIYLIPAFMMFSIWMAAGLLRLFAGIDELRRAVPALRQAGHARLALGISAVFVAAVPGFSIATNFDRLDLSGDTEASDYAESAFQTMPPGSIVFARSEETVFSLWYQSYVAERGRAVMPVSVPHIAFDWYWDDLARQFPDRIPDARPQGFQNRVLSIIDHNLGVTPLYEADIAIAHLPEFRLVEDGVLTRIEP